MPPPAQPIEIDSSQFALQELAHYRERWRDTQTLADQRVTTLLTTVGAAIAISTAVLAHGLPKGEVDTNALLSGLWWVVAAVSEAVFLRLVRARQTITRDISIINYLRQALLRDLTNGPMQEALARIANADNKPPRVFAPLSSPSAASISGTCSAFVAVWFGVSGLINRPPLASYLVASALLTVNLALNLGMQVRGTRRLKALEPETAAEATK
jgi:hypothetical protein